MENSYNLIFEKWIPTNTGFSSIMDCIENESICWVGSTAKESLCIINLLKAIAHASNNFNTDEDITNTPLEQFKANIINYLNNNKDKFYLYGDHPFLQFIKLNEYNKNEYKVECKISQIHQENSGDGICVYDVNNYYNHEYTDKEKAMLLVTNNGGCNISFKAFGKSTKDFKKPNNKMIVFTKDEKYEPSSVNTIPGPLVGKEGYLHAFIMGGSILQSIYINMFSEEKIKDIGYGCLGTPPWDYENMDETCDYKNMFYSSLIPMNNFILFNKDDNFNFRIKQGIEYRIAVPYIEKGVQKYNYYFDNIIRIPTIFVYQKTIKDKNNSDEQKVWKIIGSSEKNNIAFSFKDYINYMSDSKGIEWNNSIINSQVIIDNYGFDINKFEIIFINIKYIDNTGLNYLQKEEIRSIDCNTIIYKDENRFFDYCSFVDKANDLIAVYSKKIRKLMDFKDEKNNAFQSCKYNFEQECNTYLNKCYFEIWSIEKIIDRDAEYKNAYIKIRSIFEKTIQLDVPFKRGEKLMMLEEIDKIFNKNNKKVS